jgi:hypothetical protein
MNQTKVPKINIKNTQENVELFQACASKDANVAMEARQTVAGFIGPVIQQVLNLKGSVNGIYTDWSYNEDDYPTIPLDKYYGVGVNAVQVWQQNIPGGLGTSLQTGLIEMIVSTYALETAISFMLRDLKRGRLNSLSLGLNRTAQELLVKTERNGWLIALRALAEGITNGLRHTIAATTSNVIQVDDFNRLLTRAKRINTAFNGGTPDQLFSRGCTDMFLSPEAMEQIRAFAYQPMNTRGVPNSDESTALGLPDAVRQSIYNSAGTSEIYGITLHEQLEFGDGQVYNSIFASFAAGGIITNATDQLVFGIDLTREVLIRPIATNAENGSSLTMQIDDQFGNRSGKVGYFGGIEEGRVCLDSRALSGLIV